MGRWTFFPAWIAMCVSYGIAMRAWWLARSLYEKAKRDLDYSRSEVRALKKRLREYEEREARLPMNEPGSGGSVDRSEPVPWGTPNVDGRVRMYPLAGVWGTVEVIGTETESLAKHLAYNAVRTHHGGDYVAGSLSHLHDVIIFGETYPSRHFRYRVREP